MTSLKTELNRMFLRDFTQRACINCHKVECVCPTCFICGQKGNFQCYIKHGLESHAVAIAHQEYLVDCAKEQLALEEQMLDEIKNDPTFVAPWFRHGGRRDS